MKTSVFPRHAAAGRSACCELHLSKSGPWWDVGPFCLLIQENSNFLSEVGINRKDGP